MTYERLFLILAILALFDLMFVVALARPIKYDEHGKPIRVPFEDGKRRR
jgi:hypothetical protein